MKTRHGLEIKELLEKKRLSKSRFNPESQVSIVNDRPRVHHSKQIKKVQSATSLHIEDQLKARKSSTGLQKMQRRYHQLYQQYLKLVDQQKTKVQMCKKQAQQISKYQKAAQRDKKQIQRLRSMIGFINKKDSSTQTLNSQSKNTSQDITVQSIVGRPIIGEKGLFDFNGIEKQQKDIEELKNYYKQSDIFKKSAVEIRNNKNDESKINRNNESRINKNDESRINRNDGVRSVRKDHNSKQSKSLNKSSSKHLYTMHVLSPKKQFQTQKKSVKKYETFSGTSQKMTESMLYGSKSSVDLRKKRSYNPNHYQKNSQIFIQHSRQLIKQSRINSPNSKYKFIPSVDI